LFGVITGDHLRDNKEKVRKGLNCKKGDGGTLDNGQLSKKKGRSGTTGNLGIGARSKRSTRYKRGKV